MRLNKNGDLQRTRHQLKLDSIQDLGKNALQCATSLIYINILKSNTLERKIGQTHIHKTKLWIYIIIL